MLLAAALALAPMTARAHPRGFHKHTQVIVHPDRVEILVRGLDIDPNTLRPRLKLSGDDAATVVLTRIGRSPMAFVCRAHRIP